MVDRVLTSRSNIYYRHVDLSEEERGRELFFELGGRSIPATFLIGPDEQLVDKFIGYRSESGLTSWLESHGL